MNKDRRKTISDIQEKIEELKSQLESLELDTVRDDEQEYFNNMPESMQGGDKGQAAEAAVDALSQAVDSIQEAIDALDSAVSSMETAKE